LGGRKGIRPVKKPWDFHGAGEDNGGRGTDSPVGRHPNRTNSTPTPTTPLSYNMVVVVK